MRKIAVTGTKGKTTVVNVVATILFELNNDVLKVDTTGHYVNGEQKSTLEDSKRIWGLVPTVCPGRYLSECADNSKLEEGIAVLETALGCSASAGLGYRAHEIGVFLNVFEDHLGSSKRLKTREDIAVAKSFIFERLDRNGVAVFNADDPLVCKMLTRVPENMNTSLIPCGLTFKYFDVKKHLKAGGVAITYKDQQIVMLKNTEKTVLADLKAIPWTFNGVFEPSVWNLLHVCGALVAYFKGDLPKNLKETIESTRLDPYGGRLTLLKAKNGATILADYAHEKESLVKVGELARTLVKNDGKVVGVVRLAHDRADELMTETGHVIASAYDQFVVYEKIDGYWRKPKAQRSSLFPQIVGRTSQIFADAIKQKNPNVERIMREDQAIEYASKIAGPNDVIVVIVNDDIKRSINFVQKYFEAEVV